MVGFTICRIKFGWNFGIFGKFGVFNLIVESSKLFWCSCKLQITRWNQMISLQFWSTVLIEDCLFHCIIIFCFGYVFNCFIRYHILNFYSKLFFWVLFLDWFLIGLKEYKKKWIKVIRLLELLWKNKFLGLSILERTMTFGPVCKNNLMIFEKSSSVHVCC